MGGRDEQIGLGHVQLFFREGAQAVRHLGPGEEEVEAHDALETASTVLEENRTRRELLARTPGHRDAPRHSGQAHGPARRDVDHARRTHDCGP